MWRCKPEIYPFLMAGNYFFIFDKAFFLLFVYILHFNFFWILIIKYFRCACDMCKHLQLKCENIQINKLAALKYLLLPRFHICQKCDFADFVHLVGIIMSIVNIFNSLVVLFIRTDWGFRMKMFSGAPGELVFLANW